MVVPNVIAPVLRTGLDPILTAVGKQVAAGRCILFLGAGVHRPPPDGSEYRYDAALSPPAGRQLSNELAGECDYAAAFPGGDETNLARVAAFFESAQGRPALVQRIRQAVGTGRKPSAAVRALAALDFPLVITTNYDQLFEASLTAAHKEFDKCVYSPDEVVLTRDIDGGLPSAEHPFVLKIHGDVANPESIVLTEEDYIQFVLRMGDKEQVNPVPLGVRFALKSWPTLFIGYSLHDINLRLLFKTLRWRMDRASFPISYAVDPAPDRLIVRILAEGPTRQIIFVAQDVWTFVPALYRFVRGEEMPV